MKGKKENLQEYFNRLVERRIFKSHLTYEMMNTGLTEHVGKTIYTARNPKDVAVSFYYHDRGKMEYQGSWDQYFERYVAGKVHFGFFFDHVLGWWNASKKQDNILFLTFEEMKRDPNGIINKVAKFIGTPLTPDLLAKVAKKSEFKSMAKNNKANYEWLIPVEGETQQLRKGVVGDWRNHFTPSQNERLEAAMDEHLSGSGLVFDFRENQLLA